jgi:hypothetical protein
MGVNYVNVEPISNITKSNLELLISEIRELNSLPEIWDLLDLWVRANELHPEKVKTFKNTQELNEYLGKENV